ncbi:MAG: GNAT family N-acetyltransferase [Candidatus Wallbacteria bacterium]|nr:GNAT family N-acetyltransferase [Candidatus Wallbacteria bacterium]
MYQGRLVGLREFKAEDLPRIHKWVNDERLNKYLSFATFPRTVEQTKAFLETRLRPTGRSEVDFVVYTLSDRTQRYIGSVGLKNIDWLHGHAELHAGLGGVEYLGKGYGSDATRLLVRYGFDRLNLNKIWLQVIEFNIGGRKAYENAGFRVDGRLRAHLRYGGKTHDLLIMSILRDEYYARLEAVPEQAPPPAKPLRRSGSKRGA